MTTGVVDPSTSWDQLGSCGIENANHQAAEHGLQHLQETEKRLKDIVTGKKAAVLANANGVSKKASVMGSRNNKPVMFTVRSLRLSSAHASRLAVSF